MILYLLQRPRFPVDLVECSVMRLSEEATAVTSVFFKCPGYCVCFRVPNFRKGLTGNQCEKSAPFTGRLRS